MLENNLTLEYIFKNDIKDPFFYNLQLNEIEDCGKLFETVKNIFLTGLIIKYGDVEKQSIDIPSLSKEKFDKISKYMLSIGLSVRLTFVDEKEKDYLFRQFLYQIENIEGINILVQTNWKTGLLGNINITMSPGEEDSDKEVKDKLEEIKTIAKKHPITNHFLKIYKPTCLKDYAILVNIDNQSLYVVSFDYANVGDTARNLTGVHGPWQR